MTAPTARISGRSGPGAEGCLTFRSPDAADRYALGDHVDCLCAALPAAHLSGQGTRLILIEDPILLAPHVCRRVCQILADLITRAIGAAAHCGGMIVVELQNAGIEIHGRVADSGGSALDVKRPARPSVAEQMAMELGGSIDWRLARRGVTATFSFPAAVGRLA